MERILERTDDWRAYVPHESNGSASSAESAIIRDILHVPPSLSFTASFFYLYTVSSSMDIAFADVESVWQGRHCGQ